MFRKILIANRGEIAVRVIRACKEMGIATVAVYSEPDRETLHVQLADQSVCIGPGPVKDSYLHITNILSATVLTGAEAIHPGYGLLAEDEKFARMCEKCNIKFIGPPPAAMHDMGDKLNARRTMIAAGVPVIPGSEDILRDEAQALADAERVGYPVMIKAAAGGGGRGIRRVDHPDELKNALRTCKAEAGAAFNDDRLYLEKMLQNVRHIEIQILADSQGNVIHLGERDCSLQYRRQKLVEESPSTFVDAALREKMGNAAVTAARAVHYTGAGTIEFLVDEVKNFYFMEMNTRVQVEHPVTEMVTGVDIIQQQILVAAGYPLSHKQEDVRLQGHALECRICANDPEHGFAPSSGHVKLIHTPGGLGVRFDSYLYDGCFVPSFYDSMLAKIIVHAPDREKAIMRMKRALSELVLEGLTLNTDFHYDIISQPFFEEGEFHIDTIEGLL